MKVPNTVEEHLTLAQPLVCNEANSFLFSLLINLLFAILVTIYS